MGYRQPIEDKLAGDYEKFLRYCLEIGKKFVDELDAEDFLLLTVQNFLFPLKKLSS